MRERASPVTRVIHAAILHHEARAELKEIVQETGQLEVPRLERRLGIPATIGFITPLLGLLGTIIGLIEAFRTSRRKAASPAPRTSPAAFTRACSPPPPASSLPSRAPSPTPIFPGGERDHARLRERAGIEIVNLITESRRPRGGDY